MNARELLLSFKGDVSGLRQSTAEVKRTLGSTAGDAEKAGTTTSKKFGGGLKSGILGASKMVAGPLAALFAVDKAKDFFAESISGWRDHTKLLAQSAAVVKSTGGAANITAKQMGALSDKIEAQTGVDGDLVLNGENVLATFTNVRNGVGKNNKVFDQATGVIADMSVALGQDTKAGAIQLGKALNDPIKGVTALGKVGVSFTEQQKKQIAGLVKHGKTMDAQKIILGELNKEFGGSAKAQMTAGDRMTVAWHGFQDEVGSKLLPVLDQFQGFLADKILPAASAVAGFVFDKLIPGITGFFQSLKGGDTGGASSMFESLSGAVGKVAHGFAVVGTTIGKIAMPIFKAVVSVIKQNMPQIKGILGDAGDAFGSLGQALGGLGKIMLGVWKVIGPTVISLLKNTLGTVIGVLSGVFKVVSGLFEILAGIFTGNGKKIKEGFGKVLGGLGKIVGSIFRGMWSAVKILTAPAVKWITGKITDLKNGITGKLRAAWDWVKGTFGKLWAGAKSLITRPIEGARDAVGNAFGKVRGKFSDAKNWVSGTWRKGWSGVKGWIGDAVGKGKDVVKDTLQQTRDRFTNVKGFVSGTWRKGWGAVKGWLSDPVGKGKEKIAGFLSEHKGLGKVFSGAVGMIGRIWGGLKSVLIKPINAAIGVINRGLIKGGINWILGKLHVPSKQQLPWIPTIRLADGGRVRGANGFQRGGVDRIPALLDHDEQVINRRSTRAAERQLPGGLDYLNKTGRWPVGPAAEVAGADVNARRGRGVPTNLDGIPGNLAAIAARGPRQGDPSGWGANPLGYAVGQLGQMGWYNRCLAFVNAAWNYSVGRFRLATARQSANAGPRTMGGVAPAGAAGYWDTGWAGHVALSAGDGSYFSNDVVVPGRIDRVPKSRIDAWGPFMGWWHPNGAAAGTGAPGGKLGAMITGAWDFLKGLDPIKWLRDKAASIAGGISQGGILANGLRQIPRTILDLGGSGLRNLFAGVFDSGGVLPVGTSLVHNATGRPEQLFNVDDVLAAAGRTGGDTYVFNIVDALDEAAVARKIEGILLRHGRITGPVQITRRTGANR